MKTKTKRRNTAIFFALISQMKGYDSRYRDLIKEGVINDFLTGIYGDRHGRELSLTGLSDIEYAKLISLIKRDLLNAASVEKIQEMAVRRRLTHHILNTLSRIGIRAVDGDYSEVNYHISRLPISKCRIIPQFKTEELPDLLNAVRAYCDVLKIKQQRNIVLTKMN